MTACSVVNMWLTWFFFSVNKFSCVTKEILFSLQIGFFKVLCYFRSFTWKGYQRGCSSLTLPSHRQQYPGWEPLLGFSYNISPGLFSELVYSKIKTWALKKEREMEIYWRKKKTGKKKRKKRIQYIWLKRKHFSSMQEINVISVAWWKKRERVVFAKGRGW